MFEESLQMPFVVRWPGHIRPGVEIDNLIQNIDYAPTLLEMAGLSAPDDVQGRSFHPLLTGKDLLNPWRTSIYYAYYEVGEHNVPQHFGVRSKSHKLIYFPATDEWNLFDLENDPSETRNVYGQADQLAARKSMTDEFHRLRKLYDAPPLENQ